MNINIPRGTFDIIGDDMRFRNAIIDNVMKLAESYGFENIQTPIFESTSLFKRSVGDETDIVSKEMYTFEDKKGRSITLRPELTAPVVRSYIENKFYATNPKMKACYYGPAFRYERPQAGRFRQFHQFGVESFGTRNPHHDAEVIALAFSILKHFNLEEKAVLKINSLGSKENRQAYIETLKTHLRAHQEELCSDCQTRLEKNTLRVLDCKIDSPKEFMQDAPKMIDSLTEESKAYFDQVLATLDELGIAYEIDHKLVRGLDYYNDTVFEFVLDNGKAQNTVIGGGRYDGLVEQLNGPATPAFGFGMGVERLLTAIIEANPGVMEDYTKKCDIFYMPLTSEAEKLVVASMAKLRFESIRCEYAGEIKSFKANFKQAEKLGAIYAVIIGEEELANGEVTVRNLYTREESKVTLAEFENDILVNQEGEGHE